ncbi:MAG TPA: DNRLRE domain-containing protein, partial [Acidimicrobiales bacterium]|nr:DNRLRE domain-containing protein [Acidimicrobiales bacterium]
PAGLNTNVEVNFEFTGSDNQTPADQLEFECRLDSALETAWESCSSPETLQDLSFGEHTFEVRASDAAGNVDPTPATRTWTVIDLTPPDTEILTTPADVTEDATATFTFAADEPGATFECSLDGADYATCASGVTYSALAVGAHSFAVRALDLAGNPDVTPATFSWIVVSTVAPVATISAGPGATVEDVNPSVFGFAVDVPLVTLDAFECSLDGGAFEPCDNPAEFDLPVGDYTLAVRAVDLLGKAGPASATYSWSVVPFVDPDPDVNNTPAGTDVGVLLDTGGGDVLITFATVTAAGNTTAVETTSAPALPSNILVGVSTYDISTTATFSGPITICLPYDPDQYADTNTIRLYHFENGVWVDVTLYVNLTAEQVCGQVSSLSPFAVVFDPSLASTPVPTEEPTAAPTDEPTSTPTDEPTAAPTEEPTATPTEEPTAAPTDEPTSTPTNTPTATPTNTPVPVACTLTTATYASIADAWIDQGSSSSNKGTDSTLKVQGKSGNSNMRALLRFNLPTTLPSGCVVESATLRLYSGSSTSNRTIQALQVSGSWTEGGVTWANQPATTGAAATTASGSGSGWREWNVTSQVQAIFTAGANNGFLMRDAVENSGSFEQQYYSREKNNQQVPQLVVRFGSAPVPTATPTATAISTPTATNTATPEPTATNTATPEPTATNTATPEPTAT